MASLRPLLLALSLVMLAACQMAQPTTYAPATTADGYGYRDTRLDGETWRVSVAGNSQTSRELVENQLLYRAAEIAKEEGATGFYILDREVERNSQVLPTAYFDPYFAYPWGPFWAGYNSRFYGYRHYPRVGFGAAYGFNGWTAGVGRTYGYGYPWGGGRTITKYKAYAEIRLYEGERPPGVGPAFDAEQLLVNLASQVNKPAPTE